MKAEQIEIEAAKQLGIKTFQAKDAVKLLDEGNTVPFIARYRKEATGGLTEEQLHSLEEIINYLRNLVKRQDEVKRSIDEQGKLTADLLEKIEGAVKLQELEDIYLPYKPKKRTRATIARSKGLLPLAERFLRQEGEKDASFYAAEFVDEDMAQSPQEVIEGAQDIIAEMETEKAAVRSHFRDEFWREGILQVQLEKENDVEGIFSMYEDYSEPVKSLPSHRILAINRGEKSGALKVKLAVDTEKSLKWLCRNVDEKKPFAENLKAALIDGYKRLLFPALEREVRAELTKQADQKAIEVFGKNLRQLLLQPPLAGHIVMGLDPGYRTGCKVAIVDATGQVLDHSVFYITRSEAEKQKAYSLAEKLIARYNVDLVSIGNGTASYETEQFVALLIKEHNLKIHYLVTSEAGASVYSASKLAVEELPQYDVTVRGAVSIARRVQDPLAELVKIEPKAIGVGQYQHDVDQKELASALDIVVKSAVNHVGVELNTASAALLKYVSGINATVAKNIIAYRDANGRFAERKQLLKVPRLGKAAFTQCAGFLRIKGGKVSLDNTPVHPESYDLTARFLAALGFETLDILSAERLEKLRKVLLKVDFSCMAKKLEAGEPTLRDIAEAIARPGRDPRSDLPQPLTRKAIVSLDDIKVGTVMRGTVRNITDFGAFIDIGIKTAGLVHISEISNSYIKHPLDVLSVGQVVDVLVISVDAKRNRIGLSIKQVPKG